MVFVRSGGDDTFETGTASLECSLVKALPLGPKGEKGVICSSDAKTEVPSLVCPVTTNRGAGRGDAPDMLVGTDGLET
jgi:hypothetical protein